MCLSEYLNVKIELWYLTHRNEMQKYIDLSDEYLHCEHCPTIRLFHKDINHYCPLYFDGVIPDPIFQSMTETHTRGSDILLQQLLQQQ